MGQALLRDVAALQTAYAAGTWRPLLVEFNLAADLARGQWTGPFLRAGLRQGGEALCEGSLQGVLESAAAVYEGPETDGPEVSEVLVRLRQLVDVLADGRETVT